MKSNIAWGCFVATLGIGCGLWLLISLEKISGTEFVALSLGFSIIGLIIAFSAEVQEFSIAGNGVKLKELRSEAEKTIEELKQARTEMFRFLVLQVLQGSQQTLAISDPRIKIFLRVYEQIEKFDLIKELETDIESVLHVLLVSQYGNLIVIHENSRTIDDNFEKLESPTELFIKLQDDMIGKFLKYNNFYKNNEEAKIVIIAGINDYSKLYAIKVQLDNLET